MNPERKVTAADVEGDTPTTQRPAIVGRLEHALPQPIAAHAP